MYVLVTFTETVKIPANKLHQPLRETIEEQLNEKFANKVIIDVGLCIVLYDILTIGKSFLHQGDSASSTQVKFRYVVFRPFIGETLVGKIRSCSREGVHVSLGFFDDILIAPGFLQEPCRFDEKEQLWVWEYIDDESGEKHDMLMDVGEKIRFKVREEIFKDTSPSGPSNVNETQPTVDRIRKVPYSILGTCSESGLGLVSWWK